MIKVGKIVEVDYDYWGACHTFECDLCKKSFNTYSTLPAGVFYMCGEGDDCPWCLEKYKPIEPIQNQVKQCGRCRLKYIDLHDKQTISCKCGAGYCSTYCSLLGNVSYFRYDNEGNKENPLNDIGIYCGICGGDDNIKAICERCNEHLSVFYDMGGEKTVWCKCGTVSKA